jgi:hypothetical protein
VVGATGFEPATPCAQGRCATRLRYAPTPRSYVDRSRNCVRGIETEHRTHCANLRNRPNQGFFATRGAGMSPASVVPMLEASLLDDARFLEELAKIDALPNEDTSVFPKPVPTVGDNQPPAAIVNDLPRTLGPHTKGPQFVLAPPPSKRRSSSYRSSSRSDSSRATSDEQYSKPAPLRLAEKNPGTEASLSAFPSESARSTGNNNTGRQRASDTKRSAPLHPALAVVGFVLMMSVGAGVAALVFHDRVTEIVQLLDRSAARR